MPITENHDYITEKASSNFALPRSAKQLIMCNIKQLSSLSEVQSLNMSFQSQNIYADLFIGELVGSIYRLFNATIGKYIRSSLPPRRDPPYNHFTQIGDPVLRKVADAVAIKKVPSPCIDLIIKQMIDVLRHYDCVGIAAPQIGIPLRIIVMEFHEGKKKQFSPLIYAARQMSTLPLTVIINPEIEMIGDKKLKHPEGCMSVRGYMAEVERYEKVKITGIDQKGTPLEMNLIGWNARIAQHEMDHLDGGLYIDRMDILTFTNVAWKSVNEHGGRAVIPFDR